MSDYTPKHVAGDENLTPVEYQKPVSMMFSNQTYDKLKWIAQILLPALGTLYATVGYIWGLPRVEEIVSTILAVDTFLGVMLSLSNKSYESSGAKYDGHVSVQTGTEDQKSLALSLDANPSEIEGQKEITLKVDNT